MLLSDIPECQQGMAELLPRMKGKISLIMGLFTVSIVSIKWCQIISVVWDPIAVQHIIYYGHVEHLNARNDKMAARENLEMPH